MEQADQQMDGECVRCKTCGKNADRLYRSNLSLNGIGSLSQFR